jgi:hypothetical protein
MFQRSNIRRILRTFLQAAATCAAALSLTGANVHAQSPTQVAPFSLVAAELDLLVSEDTRAARVDGISYFVIDDRGAVVRGPVVVVKGSPAPAREAFERDFRAAILKAAPFDPLKQYVGKVLVLRLSTCGSGADASCGHELKSVPPKLVQSWRAQK